MQPNDPDSNKTAFQASKSRIGIIHLIRKLTSISSVPVPLIIRGSFNPSSSFVQSRGVTQNSPESYREKLPASPESIYCGFRGIPPSNRGQDGYLSGELYVRLKKKALFEDKGEKEAKILINQLGYAVPTDRVGSLFNSRPTSFLP